MHPHNTRTQRPSGRVTPAGAALCRQPAAGGLQQGSGHRRRSTRDHLFSPTDRDSTTSHSATQQTFRLSSFEPLLRRRNPGITLAGKRLFSSNGQGGVAPGTGTGPDRTAPHVCDSRWFAAFASCPCRRRPRQARPAGPSQAPCTHAGLSFLDPQVGRAWTRTELTVLHRTIGTTLRQQPGSRRGRMHGSGK